MVPTTRRKRRRRMSLPAEKREAMTNLHFCETCNKLRLTADGKLRPCLGSHLEFDFRDALRDPATTEADLERLFLEVVARKPKEHEFRDNYQPRRRMIAIGG
jgi:cyclic pyranopterin phosphate synthase